MDIEKKKFDEAVNLCFLRLWDIDYIKIVELCFDLIKIF